MGYRRSLLKKTGVISLWLLTSAHAQPPASSGEPASTLKFDVASVRENRSGTPPAGEAASSNVPLGPGNVYSPTGGLFTAKNFPLVTYISFAYRMTDHQLETFEEAAPDWVKHTRFNIMARSEKQDVSKDELRAMVRALLKDRFHFSAHYENREVRVYALRPVTDGQTGPRLRVHPTESPCPRTVPGREAESAGPPSETVTGGFPTTCGGIILLPSSSPTRVRIGGRDIPLSLLANSLTSWGQLDHPVKDETGVTGNVDFVLEYVPELRPEPGTNPGPSAEMGADGPGFREALKKQLGLKLEAEKGEVPVLVLDHIETLRED